jgi:AraC-like DNA-binding protein
LGEFLFLNLDIAQFGSNTKTIIKDENSMVMMISDETGEGKMTVHQILPGIMICFTDMHMEQCTSEFELNSGQKVLCIDQCREGRIEMENQPGIFSIMRENELRVDDRKHHKGMAYYPLRHYHGVSIFLEVHAAQKSLDEMFHGFSIDLKPYYDKTQMEKICAIHEQITSNLQVRVTIEELSKQYDMPATSMKKCFREIYGDSIYSYQKRYRMNVAANLLMEDSKVEIQEIALKMGYENPGKFSSAFKSVMGVTPAKYRKH